MHYFNSVAYDYGNVEGLTGSEDQYKSLNFTSTSLKQNNISYSSINPLHDSDNYGIELYEQTLEFLRQNFKQHSLFHVLLILAFS